MLAFRGVLAVVMMLVGAYVVIRMLHYPIAQSFTGIILGAAMVFLGFLRLRQVREVMQKR